ncbi:MAG: flagellar basal body rod protein FlgC [Candidatus Binatales bacterium]|jgi:flagellar basal-body rod protein FlgC
MSIENILGIAGSALDAQSERISIIAQNMANASSVQSPDGGPYQRRIPVFESTTVGDDSDQASGVTLAAVLRDQSPPKQTYDPSNPLADAKGMVQEPTVNPVFEMVDLMEASRAYQANLSVVETAKNTAMRTIDILK